MRSALLDVNVLVALFDPGHINHEEAHRWLVSLGRTKWAICPITINGCIRVLSQPRYAGRPLTVIEAASRLRFACDKGAHEFWPNEISLLEESRFDLNRVGGPSQLTDLYLLALAISREGYLATFDRSIPWQAVKGAKSSNLVVIGSN